MLICSKFETEEMEDALGKHHHIIKRCAERDPALMRSKVWISNFPVSNVVVQFVNSVELALFSYDSFF